jgi:inorganic pyrophosphatase
MTKIISQDQAQQDKQQYIQRARELFTKLLAENPSAYNDASIVADYIKSELRQAHVSFAALDPTGKKSSAVMEQTLNKAVTDKEIQRARQLFTNLLAGNTSEYLDASSVADDLKRSLRIAHVSFAALDPTGKKSSAVMEQTLNKAVADKEIQKARELFTNLLAGDASGYSPPEAVIGVIKLNLQQAGVDLSALDPTSKKSSAEIQQALDKAVQKIK